ncbi:MAG: isoprenylcysteine carboxylmethyltransferase family protein [Planctomycetota bacterium]|nr:MAG: isoprenylcysteine carboxylmethyltransferase family protein [Planctomycetota bacterium]
MSYIYVVIQVLFIILIGATGPIIPNNIAILTGIAIGVFTMFWALWTMRLSNLNMMPDLKHKSVLVTSGPYRVIRHPMYASVLLVTLMLVANHLTLLRTGFWLVLLIDLYFKFSYEEKLLLKKHPGYIDYKKKTKRLIPFIY